MTQVIRIAVALMTGIDGTLLLVRKRGTTAFMQPGGKIDGAEAPATTLARELNEELGLTVDPAGFELLGEREAPAVNEPGAIVSAVLFRVQVSEEERAAISPKAEIEEICWLDPQAWDEKRPIAPLTRDHVLPFCR